MAYSGKFQVEADPSVDASAGSIELRTAFLDTDLTLPNGATISGDLSLPDGSPPVEPASDTSMPADASTGTVTAAAAPKRNSRREEITGILAHQSTESLSLRDKQKIGNWLGSHYEQLKSAAPALDALDKSDIIAAYATARWTDKLKFLWSDMRMLKRVASHFDEIALGGANAETIDAEDIEALKRGGTVKRTPSDVTTTYPDGELDRRTKDGVLFKKSAAGSMSFDSAMFKLELAANGHGYLRYKMPGVQFSLGEESNEIKLTRNEKGIWSGKTKDGEDLDLAIDEHSIRMQSPGMDVLLTSTGGFFRDPSDPESMAVINPDGSMTMTENGKAVTIGTDTDTGVLMAVDSEGGTLVQYPIGVEYWSDPKEGSGIKGGDALPDVRADNDGSLKVFVAGAEPLTAQPDADGKTEITHPSGVKVTHTKDGTFEFRAQAVDEAGSTLPITIAITADGTFTLRAPAGGTAEFKPPQLRRPPAIR
jgi:hypothetical protein